MDQVRFGILGAARIVPWAVLAPAAVVSEVTVAAIAARDRRRAEAVAAKRHIPRAVQDGAPVLTSPADAVANIRVVDAVYAQVGLRPRGEGEEQAPLRLRFDGSRGRGRSRSAFTRRARVADALGRTTRP